MLDSF